MLTGNLSKREVPISYVLWLCVSIMFVQYSFHFYSSNHSLGGGGGGGGGTGSNICICIVE